MWKKQSALIKINTTPQATPSQAKIIQSFPLLQLCSNNIFWKFPRKQPTLSVILLTSSQCAQRDPVYNSALPITETVPNAPRGADILSRLLVSRMHSLEVTPADSRGDDVTRRAQPPSTLQPQLCH